MPTKTKKTSNSKFQGGHKGSTYKCGACGKLTRETGQDESYVELCAFCYGEAGLENSLSDGSIDQAGFDAEIEKLRAAYGREPKAAKKPTRKEVAAAEAELDALDALTEKRNAKVVAALPKIHIADACAAKGCEAPPFADSSYCGVHAAAAVPPKAKATHADRVKAVTSDPELRARFAKLVAANPAAATFVKNGKLDRQALKAAVEGNPRPEVPAAQALRELEAAKQKVAKQEKAAVSPGAPKTALNQPEASTIVATLLSKGWTHKSIGAALGGLNAGYALDWALGKGCGRIVPLRALLATGAPADETKVKTVKAPKAKAPKEQVETGSLKAPAASQAAKVATPYSDPRQLFLDLRNALDAVLKLSR